MENKICIVVSANLTYLPFYYRYEELLDKYNMPFDLIIWNRQGVDIVSKAKNIYEFKLLDSTNNGNWKKINKFFKFSNYVKHKLKDNTYSFVFFLGTYAGNGILLNRFLRKNYKYKYLLDIRDYTYEWFLPYKLMEWQVINNAHTVVVSSKGYFSFLPQNKNYIVAHNIDWENINAAQNSKRIVDSNRIRISFIGNMRYYDENFRFLNLMKNDERFIIQYYGTGCEILKEYCENQSINNVSFMGRFDRSETANLYANTDIVNNLYGNNKTFLKLALSNKLYYSLFLGLPILVCENTYMEEITTIGKIGFTVDYNDPNIKDKLYAFVRNYNSKSYESEKLKEQVLFEDNEFVESIKRLINR